MKHKYVLASLLLIFISQFAPIPSTNAVETIILEPIADAAVSNHTESYNNTELKVGRLNNTVWITYIMFDLSNVSFNTLEWAKLKLRVKNFIPDGNRWVEAVNASTEWREDEITWSNKPERNIGLSMEQVDFLEDWCAWSCSLAVSHAESGKLSIALEPSLGADGYIVFYARESEHKPQLEVKYSPSPKIGPTLSAVAIAIAVISLSGILYLTYRLRKRKMKP